MKLIVAADK